MNDIIIFSGGLDSTTLLYKQIKEGNNVKAISFNYGQRHSRELLHAVNIARHLGVEYRQVDLRTLTPLLGGSSQTSDEIEVPEGHYENENMKLTVVPNRNMIMISVATAWAISSNYERVLYGAHSGDHVIYPDCRPSFVSALEAAIKFCDWKDVELVAPFLVYNKSEIVKLGAALCVPYELTWSCYKGNENHCGKCGTCIERREAFKEANVKDPTKYEAN